MITAAAMMLAFSTVSSAIGIITFNELGQGDVVTNQYLPGVIFSPGINGVTGLTNPSGPDIGFATNTHLNVTPVSTDVGGGVAAPISGLLLHSWTDWLMDNGDPVFTMDFVNPIKKIQLDFAGVSGPGSGIYAVDGSNAVVASSVALSSGTSTVSLALSVPVRRFVVTLGTPYDWVGVDNIMYTEAPEPSDTMLITAGIGAFALLRRRALRRT
jgi:hypothetical protein